MKEKIFVILFSPLLIMILIGVVATIGGFIMQGFNKGFWWGLLSIYTVVLSVYISGAIMGVGRSESRY